MPWRWNSLHLRVPLVLSILICEKHKWPIYFQGPLLVQVSYLLIWQRTISVACPFAEHEVCQIVEGWSGHQASRVFCAGAQSGNTVTKLLGRHVKTVTPMVAGNVATELFGFSGVLLCPHGLPQKLLYILLPLFFFLCPVSMHSVGPKSSNCKILDLQKETSEAGCESFLICSDWFNLFVGGHCPWSYWASIQGSGKDAPKHWRVSGVDSVFLQVCLDVAEDLTGGILDARREYQFWVNIVESIQLHWMVVSTGRT